jgi:hypothetical protein
MDDCRNYTLNTQQNGKPGYLTNCQEYNYLVTTGASINCEPGYTATAMCSGTAQNCRNKCGEGSNNPNAAPCGAGGQRRICKKNLSAYKPIKDGNTYDKCCTVTSATVRNSNDCPMTYSPDSTACTDTLLEKCVDDADLSKIADYSCAVLATNKNYSVKSKYNKAASQYCDDEKNLKSEFCLNWCKDNKSKCIQKLRDVCYNKEGVPSFKSVCACYYPQTFYDKINKEIGDVWKVPPEFMNSNPECMFPQCQVSELRNKNVKCPETSFVKCINEQNFNLSNSTVGAVTFKETSNCGQFDKKNKTDASTGNNQSGNASTATASTATASTAAASSAAASSAAAAAAAAAAADDDDDMMAKLKKNKILILVFFILIVVAMFMMGGNDRYDDERYDDDRYDDERYYDDRESIRRSSS